jgi:hypothetical protein
VSGIETYSVYIQLSSRSEDTADWSTNRIALKCETVGITSAKQVLSFPIPGSGIITGESTALGLDLGMCTKTLNLTGIITTQEIKKKFSKDSLDNTKSYVTCDVATVTMTAHEIAQLLHSYVDSSALQTHQNMNELLVLYPSYVGKDFLYHSELESSKEPVVADLDPNTAPVLPFNYAVRDVGQNGKLLDNEFVVSSHLSAIFSDFPDPATTGADVDGMKGFIRTFNTTFTGGNPFVDFTMDFEVAITGLR